MTNYYSTLGVESTADDATIKSAYRKLAKEFHPDTNKAAGAEAKFKAIGEAYDTLKDPQKRAAYDRERAGPQPGMGGAQNFRWHTNPGNGFGQSADIDLDEILRDIRRSRNPFPEDARNRDIVLSYSITLEEAFTGKDATVKYNLPGKEANEVAFKVPPGIGEGTKLRFQGKGDTSMAGVPAGDLFIKMNIIPHPTFVRMGNHIVTSTSIDYLDAMLGAEREIPTIEGGKIKMRVPAGIHPGQSLRAAGKGMPMANGQRGDMMIEVTFQPEKLSEEIRKQLEEIRAKKNA